MTLQQQYAAGLQAIGYVEAHTVSRKYRLFEKPGASPTYFWLGKAGAVRYSSLKRIDTSIAASDRTKANILRRGNA